MFIAIFGSIESGILYAIMALGVYLSFRVLDFPDLTVDGSFVTGAAVAATLIVKGYNPFIATAIATGAGIAAGFLTGILHTKGKINPLLSGILMMIALYSINLRIMGKPNVPLLNNQTVFTDLAHVSQALGFDKVMNTIILTMNMGGRLPKTWSVIIFMLLFVCTIKCLLDRFLKTELGLALRATGDNKNMIRSFSANTDSLTILGLGISNGLVALSGALIAQYGSFADVGLGIGMIIIGLASVIIGEAFFGTKTIARATLAVMAGAIIYRIIVALALRIEFVDTGDMKLITAAMVIFALIMPKIMASQKEKRQKQRRRNKKFTHVVSAKTETI